MGGEKNNLKKYSISIYLKHIVAITIERTHEIWVQEVLEFFTTKFYVTETILNFVCTFSVFLLDHQICKESRHESSVLEFFFSQI